MNKHLAIVDVRSGVAGVAASAKKKWKTSNLLFVSRFAAEGCIIYAVFYGDIIPLNVNKKQERLDSLIRLARKRRLDAVVVFGQKNILSLTGVDCDNGCLMVSPSMGRTLVRP